jgi:hypothetical protein
VSTTPVLLVHGYSDSGAAFAPWRERLLAQGIDARAIRIAQWRSLADEITLADLAEGFDRALRGPPYARAR